ncbi:type II toxin-antitoxin system HicA family toxin [Streptococcus suis]|uniref:HicA toxin n=1 Tax=Streptococcus suis TaxID=1307 RepID=A0A0Z8PJL4_STRSU|nr:type II toxin-antitoxin system HicA family toxin [Streptococcus suis]MBY5026830.1 type II toxin-antitoxin system HicA family toxin [Streptococcus suis]MCK3935376.1 type II toxin-antitoxin system HicA family toxin [Streptococcus suis]MCQ8264050.1 type II toxin-antitoxin system HicA family toxin [Streptococcus suis]MDG4528149.1 type II toxin-antitoxin system HicA family toxin [Streptococcus suis]MDG4530520.1 type II toxin-antitoxin system HicA family toxin [Streptococcus suis]
MPRKAREIIKLLKKNGFVKVSQNGSHAKYKNFETGRIAIVPIHNGDMPKGTEDNILKQAGLK